MYIDSLDIAKNVCQLIGCDQIMSVTEDSKANLEISLAYDQCRRAELQRNTWTFAVRKVLLRPVDVDTMTLSPAQWSSTVNYLYGAIVADPNGLLWSSTRHTNLNNQPGNNNDVWEPYFGPMTAVPYDTTSSTAYYAGELVYMPGSFTGGYSIFQSLTNSNSDVPNVSTPWAATKTYHADAVVSYLGSQYKSTSELNLNITPFDGSAFLPFDATATYSIGQEVTGSDNQLYTSVGSGNIGHDPTTDGGVHWTATGTANAWAKLATSAVVSSTNWRIINAVLHNLVFTYPVGAGPSSQLTTKNVYRLPAGYLKTAPQDPKLGANSFLGAPAGLQMDDWDYDSDYIVSGIDSSPIILRFVADVTKVSGFHDMFSKGLACAIGVATCETITQSTSKLSAIEAEYKLFMGEARTVNAIEAGPVEMPEDEWITCRI